MFSSGVKLG